MITEKDMTSESIEKGYLESLDNFSLAMEIVLAISELGRNVQSDFDRQLWCKILYARMIMVGVSLLLVSPDSKLNPVPVQWDACSVATLARTIYEIYLSLEYFCFEDVEPIEWQARINLMYLHDMNARLQGIQHLQDDSEMSDCRARLQAEIGNIVLQLKENSYFQTLTEKQRNKFLKGKDHLILSQDEIVDRAQGDVKVLRRLYEKLSSETHTLPITFTLVMSEGNGLGAKNDSDMRTATLSLQLARMCFSKATHKYIAVLGGFCEIEKVVPFQLENLKLNAAAHYKFQREHPKSPTD